MLPVAWPDTGEKKNLVLIIVMLHLLSVRKARYV